MTALQFQVFDTPMTPLQLLLWIAGIVLAAVLLTVVIVSLQQRRTRTALQALQREQLALEREQLRLQARVGSLEDPSRGRLTDHG